jgi:hypothetical protein
MSDTSKLENARAAREARDSVGPRRARSSVPAVAEAMRLYVSAERYHKLKQKGHLDSKQNPSGDAG